MGSKKRGRDSAGEKEMVEEENKPTMDSSTAVEEPSKKKLKKDKKQEGMGVEQYVDAPNINGQASQKPMEKKKLKRALKDLRSADSSVREATAEKLAMEMKEDQQAYDRLDNKELVNDAVKLEAEKEDGLNDCAPSLRYAIRRLIRGVSSSIECARQGFALGLTILVGEIPQISVASMMRLVVDSLDITSSMKGQEARDCLLGQLFAYAALARSGRLNEESHLNKNMSCIKEFVDAVVALAAKKRYLQEPAVIVLLEFIEKLPVELLDQVLEAPGLRGWFEGAAENRNPDALLLALKIWERIGHGHGAFGKLLPSVYCPNQLFASDHLSSLANCLKKASFPQPRVHSIWHALVDILLRNFVTEDLDSGSSLHSVKKHKKNRKGSSGEEDLEKNLNCFVEVIIEGALLTSTHVRKHLAFDVVVLILPKLPASCIQVLLSDKLIQCLMDILSTKDSFLYKVAQNFVNELSEWVKNDDSRRVAVVMILHKHSNGKFDSITKSKTVKNLMAQFKPESGSAVLIQSLMKLFLDEGHASVEDKDSAGTIGFESSMEDQSMSFPPFELTDPMKAVLTKLKESGKRSSQPNISDLGLKYKIFQVKDKTPAKVMKLITKIQSCSLVDIPYSVEIPHRSSKYQEYVQALDRIVLRESTPKRHTKKNQASDQRICRVGGIFMILDLILRLCKKNITLSLRHLFYCGKEFYKKQSYSDGLLHDVACILKCTRSSLRLFALDDTRVIGRLRYKDGDRRVNCTTFDKSGGLIPTDLTNLTEVYSDAFFILVVEKHSIFSRLAEDKFYNKYPCIMMTGEGQPTMDARMFLRYIAANLELPVLALVDCDAWGIRIMCTYRMGSGEMAYDSANLVTPDIKWLGLLPSDIETYNIPKQCIDKVDTDSRKRKRDKTKACEDDGASKKKRNSHTHINSLEALVDKPYIQNKPEWLSEVKQLVDSKVTVELEALGELDIQYISNDYLPLKLLNEAWL